MRSTTGSRSRPWPHGRLVLGLVLSLTLGVGPGARAYEEITVTNGGTLAGSVTLFGEVPGPKGYSLVTFPDPIYCGRISDGNGWRLLQAFNVGPNGEFRDVVIAIEDVEKGKPFTWTTPRIEAVDCTFHPFITVVRNDYPVEVVNLDPAMHDIQAYETSHLGARVLFNRPLPINPRHTRESAENPYYKKHYKGEAIHQDIKMSKGRRIFVMQCGFHAFMESWAIAVDNPYYALSGEDGRFTIPNVPPGTYKVTVWHPQIGGAEEYEVTLQPNKQTTLKVELEAPKGRLYANQAMNEHRFSLGGADSREIVPTVLKQTYE